jgi:hypothetical protein
LEVVVTLQDTVTEYMLSRDDHQGCIEHIHVSHTLKGNAKKSIEKQKDKDTSQHLEKRRCLSV